MSYKNDHYLTIINKYSGASSTAKAQLYETYDKLRDLTVSGSNATGSGFGMAGNILWQLASVFAPSTFMSVMGGSNNMNIPGTSYYSPITGAMSSYDGANSAFGIGSLGSYPGFPSGASSVLYGMGSDKIGYATGGASGITGGAISAAGITGLNSAAYVAGMGSGFSIGQNVVLPIAGLVSGWGGILQSMAPYMGHYGLGALVAGNLLQGTGNAAVNAYQNITGNITANADTILEQRVINIETICKMLDTQSDVVKQMLKSDMDSNKENIQSISS